MSMKSRKGGIKSEYERALKAAKERRRYYIKKSGGLYLPEIKKTKKPTRGSIRALEKMFRGGEKAVYKREAARQRRERRKNAPVKIQTIVERRIIDIYKEAVEEAGIDSRIESIIKQAEEDVYDYPAWDSRGDWLNWKIKAFKKRMREHNLTYEQLDSVIPRLDEELNRYLYDSKNRAGGKYKEFLNKIDSLVFGKNALPGVVVFDHESDYEGMLDESYDW